MTPILCQDLGAVGEAGLAEAMLSGDGKNNPIECAGWILVSKSRYFPIIAFNPACRLGRSGRPE